MKAEKQVCIIFTNYTISDIFSQYLLTELDFSRICHFVEHNSRIAEASAAFCVFTAHQMSAAGAMTLNLAGSGYFYSFA
jgi:hypothetical protein